MRCVFVLDIFNGAVVHARRGERSLYEPIHRYSKIVSSSDPLEVVNKVKPKEVYIADLNQITGAGENLAAIESISLRARTMADIGISEAGEMTRLPDRVCPILGTETASLKAIEEAALIRDILVSIDMKNRRVLASDQKLAAISPLEVLLKLNDFSLAGVILLELDRVGTSSGLDLEFLKKAVSASNHALILGGGVKGVDDLEALEDIGFKGALVATAVHDGKVPLEMVR